MYVNLNTNISPPSVKYRDGNPGMEAEPVTARKITEGKDLHNVNLLLEAGSCAIVDISEEGRRRLELASQIRSEKPLTDFHTLDEQEQAKILKSAIKPAHANRRIIGNIRTDEKLRKSLEGASEEMRDAVDWIINNSLLPHQVGSLTEEGRQELVYAGLEEARYLSGRLQEDKAALFMEAMEEVAQYALNGEMDSMGNVKYDIRQGPPLGAPDDCIISIDEVMEKADPKAHKIFNELMGDGTDLHRICDAFRFYIDWEKNMSKNHQKEIDKVKQSQLDWMHKMKSTELKSGYHRTEHRKGAGAFIQSMMGQNQMLNSTYLMENLEEFVDVLTRGYGGSSGV